MHNKVTLTVGIKTLFKKNWKQYIDSHEIDSKLSFRENVHHLMNKYVNVKYNREEI